MDLSEKINYKLGDEKVVLAIDCIIKDTDKKFDECLVERFLEFISSRISDSSKPWFEEAKPIIERLTFYMTHNAFVMLNQARAFKVLYSILKPKKLSDDEMIKVTPLLTCMWDSFGSMIANNFMSAVTVILSILDHLLETTSGFQWLIDKKIEPPVDLSPRYNRLINDISSLVRYYIETSNNYHTKNKAEKLFIAMIENSINRHPHQQIESLKETIRDLTLQGSSSMISILIDLLKKLLNSSQTLRSVTFEQYEIPEVIQESFLVRIEQPNADMKNICKCMALSNSSRNFSTIIEKLKSKNNLEGIVVYLANSRFKSSEFNQILLTYLLYPLLTRCPGDDTQVLIKSLMATRDERDFIDKNLTRGLVTLSLVQLGQIIEDSNKAYLLSSRSLYLIMRTLANYVRCHYATTANFKEVMECCSNMGLLIKSCDRLIGDGMSIVSNPVSDAKDLISDILEAIQPEYSEEMKPVVLRLLELYRYSCKSIFRNSTKMKTLRRYIDLAFSFSDDDILDEFAHIFMSIDHVPSEYYESYIRLVWRHMYPIAKDTAHQELLGRLAHLLIDIDLQADVLSLDKFNIKRHHDIPTILGDILIEYSAVVPTVELLVDAIMTTVPRMLRDPTATSGYLNRLESPTLSKTVKKGLDHLIKGLCATVKGESNLREAPLRLIDGVTQEIITNSDDADYIVKRLSRNGTLCLLYEILTGSMYCSSVYKVAHSMFKFVQCSVIKKLDKPELLIAKHLISRQNKFSEKSLEDRVKLAQTIGLFYTQEQKFKTMENWWKQIDDKMALHSMVDDILNYELKSDGISDCY